MEKKKMKKSTIIIIVVAVVLVLGLIGIIYENVTGKPISGEDKTSEPEKTSSSQTVSEEEGISKTEDEEKVSVNIEELSSSLKEEFTDNEFHAYIRDVGVYESSDGSISIFAAVDDSTDPEVALDLADTLLRRTAALAQTQNNELSSPGHEYYGGLYDNYNAIIGVAPFSHTNDEEEWYVVDAITNGRFKELSLNKKYK